MWKNYIIICIIIINIIFCVGTSLNFSQEFFTNTLIVKFHVTPSQSLEFANTYTELLDIFPELNVNMFEILAIGWQETNWKNIMGDGNTSYGYFQIQQEAYWYVKNYFPEIYEYFKFGGDWSNSISRPDIQLVTMCLYLHLQKESYADSFMAYASYNGIGIDSKIYAMNVWNKINVLMNNYVKQGGEKYGI